MLKITEFAAKVAEIESCPDKTPFIWRQFVKRKYMRVEWTESTTIVIYKDGDKFLSIEESLIRQGVEVNSLTFDLSEQCINSFLNFKKSSRQEVIDYWIEDNRESSALRRKDDDKQSIEDFEAERKRELNQHLWFLL